MLPTIESVRSGKIGGQLGHAPYARLALPPARVDHVREYRLERCVVIDRNLTQGTRSICGHQRRQRLWTAAATCHQQGRSRTDYQCVAIQVWPSKRGHPSVAIQVWPSKRPSQATYPRSWARRALNGYKKSMSLSAAWKSPLAAEPKRSSLRTPYFRQSSAISRRYFSTISIIMTIVTVFVVLQPKISRGVAYSFVCNGCEGEKAGRILRLFRPSFRRTRPCVG